MAVRWRKGSVSVGESNKQKVIGSIPVLTTKTNLNTNTMKTQLRKLQLISRFIDMDMFYNVAVCKSYISLQSKYSSDKVLILQRLFGEFKSNDISGFIEAKRNGIKITLT